MAPSRDPAVLPIGMNGTAGKTANTQKMAKAIEPRTTLTLEAMAIFVKIWEGLIDFSYSI